MYFVYFKLSTQRFNARQSFQTLPIVGQDFGEQTGQDAEVADGEDVDVDHVTQTVNNCSENRESEWATAETETAERVDAPRRATDLRGRWRPWPCSGGSRWPRRRGCIGWGRSLGTAWWGCGTRSGACTGRGRRWRPPSRGTRWYPPSKSLGYRWRRPAKRNLDTAFVISVSLQIYSSTGLQSGSNGILIPCLNSAFMHSNFPSSCSYSRRSCLTSVFVLHFYKSNCWLHTYIELMSYVGERGWLL